MSKIHLYLLVLYYVTLFAACSEDNDTIQGNTTPENSTNANANTQGGETSRLEIPRLRDDSNNLFLVRSTVQFGVNYCIEWDCTKKSQRWTAYQMYAGNSVTNWNRNDWKNTPWKGDPFQTDPDLPEGIRVELSQHTGDNYDRGHICASADRLCSKDANEQTYYMSNMHPQLNGFNAGVWGNMENKVRAWNSTTGFRDTLYVVKGGTIDRADQILETTPKGLLVPKYFFMAILCKNSDKSQWGYKALAFWVEHTNNNDTNLKKYVISIDELEEKTGIDFFCNLPDEIEQAVERNVAPAAWGFKN